MILRDISRMAGAVIWLGLALLIAHEIDAVARHEWRLLPGFAFFQDDVARDLFVLLHVPLLAVIFWAMTHHDAGLKSAGRAVIAALLAIHGGLHFLLSGHELYEFQGVVAYITIYGAALAGAAHLALRAIDSN
jgi:Family of unknown function (DUF6713)